MPAAARVSPMRLEPFASFGRAPAFRSGSAVLAVSLLAILAAPAPAHADFFDFLFNPKSPLWAPFRQEPEQPVQRAAPVQKKKALRPAARKLHLAERSRPSGLPLASRDFMDDSSLRGGDAVMTPNGIRIFTGPRGNRHTPENFARLSEVKGLGKQERAALAALDARGTGAARAEPARSLVTGRSAAAQEDGGLLITDPKGRTIRYVGP